MQTVGQGEGGGSGIRRKYRVLKLKQEWTTSVLVGGGELQRCTFKAVALLPPEGTREVHLAAVGNAERELQAAARALSPQAPGSGTCPLPRWGRTHGGGWQCTARALDEPSSGHSILNFCSMSSTGIEMVSRATAQSCSLRMPSGRG
jgi:hypothetical protein